MDLKAYFKRIGYAGDPQPDLATLRALHRAHLLAIPYENLDVLLGRPVSLDAETAFAKIIAGGRGGWCYEMNGLFAAVLEAVGFKVVRMAGAVMREVMGNLVLGNHLVLLIEIAGERWVADVGFGDGSLEPFPLRPGPFTVAGYAFGLEQADGQWWRFRNHPFGSARSFDFIPEAAPAGVLAAHTQWHQTAPESNYVMNLVVQRFTDRGLVQLHGRVLRRVRAGGKEKRLLGSPAHLVRVLDREFGLHVPEAASLWPRILARHEQLFPLAVRPVRLHDRQGGDPADGMIQEGAHLGRNEPRAGRHPLHRPA
jgi:N-hydroxyarylamine O-acetyltransferase